MIGYIWLTAAIAAELAGTTLLKYTEGFSRLWPSLGCVAAYVFCFYALSKALHYMPLSIAYATWCALGIVAATLLSVLLFREQLTLTGIAGITLVVAGVVIPEPLGRSLTLIPPPPNKRRPSGTPFSVRSPQVSYES